MCTRYTWTWYNRFFGPGRVNSMCLSRQGGVLNRVCSGQLSVFGILVAEIPPQNLVYTVPLLFCFSCPLTCARPAGHTPLHQKHAPPWQQANAHGTCKIDFSARFQEPWGIEANPLECIFHQFPVSISSRSCLCHVPHVHMHLVHPILPEAIAIPMVLLLLVLLQPGQSIYNTIQSYAKSWWFETPVCPTHLPASKPHRHRHCIDGVATPLPRSRRCNAQMSAPTF